MEHEDPLDVLSMMEVLHTLNASYQDSARIFDLSIK